jgi:hypothetical protein
VTRENALTLFNAANAALFAGGPREWGAMMAGGLSFEVHFLPIEEGAASTRYGLLLLLNGPAKIALARAQPKHDAMMAPTGKSSRIGAHLFLDSLHRGAEFAGMVRLVAQFSNSTGSWIHGFLPLDLGHQVWHVVKLANLPDGRDVIAPSPPELNSGALSYIDNFLAQIDDKS